VAAGGSDVELHAGSTVDSVDVVGERSLFTLAGGTITNPGPLFSLSSSFYARIVVTGGQVLGPIFSAGELEVLGGNLLDVTLVGSAPASLTGGTISGDVTGGTDILVDGATILGDLRPDQDSHSRVSSGAVQDHVGIINGEFELVGGSVGSISASGNQSTLTQSGGHVFGGVGIVTGATAELSGGAIDGDMDVVYQSSLIWSGGSIGGVLRSDGNEAFVEIRGKRFQVDGLDVPFGDLEATSGRLTATLEGGEAIDIDFERTLIPQISEPEFGTIRLVEAGPAAVPTLGPAAGFMLPLMLGWIGLRLRSHRAHRIRVIVPD